MAYLVAIPLLWLLMPDKLAMRRRPLGSFARLMLCQLFALVGMGSFLVIPFVADRAHSWLAWRVIGLLLLLIYSLSRYLFHLKELVGIGQDEGIIDLW